MKIGIDIRTAGGKKAGKGWYNYHVVSALLKQDHENEYLLYTNNLAPELTEFAVDGGRAGAGVHIKVIKAKGLWWHFAVIKDFLRERGEVFFAPTSFIIPAFLPKRVRSVVTVHDLVAFLF